MGVSPPPLPGGFQDPDPDPESPQDVGLLLVFPPQEVVLFEDPQPPLPEVFPLLFPPPLVLLFIGMWSDEGPAPTGSGVAHKKKLQPPLSFGFWHL